MVTLSGNCSFSGQFVLRNVDQEEVIEVESDISAWLSSFCDKWYMNIIVQMVQKAENITEISYKSHNSVDIVGLLVT